MNKHYTIGCLAAWVLIGVIYWRLRVKGAPSLAASNGPLLGVLYRQDIEELIQADRPLPAIKPVQSPMDVRKGSEHRSHSMHVPKKTSLSTRGATVTQPSTILPTKPNPQRIWERVLEASDDAFVLTGRHQQDGIELLLAQMGHTEGLALISIRLRNDSPGELFISRVGIHLQERDIPSHTYLPISCRVGEEIRGVVVFSAQAFHHQDIFDITLYESGTKGRHWEVRHVQWPF